MASPGKRAFLLRVKPEVLDAVERLAADELRSVNAQLEVLVREGLAKRGRLKKGEGEGKA
ncbi:Arc family DNA-binding protein [Caulobacter sp. SLTY]|uniref:Arc family DNA-binding protein n=1 Tax=Caulobacter sp. SLTY TaxID=2683262 RepID=UPI0014136978|nr:Arc family DNA-binding protein [Caulobacter sp. SLTY]